MALLRALALTLALALSAVALGACGEDNSEKNDYVNAVNDATSTLNEGLRETTQGPGTRTPTEAAELFKTFATQVDTAATEISAITPPDDVAALHDELVTELGTLRAAAANAADEVQTGGPAAVSGVAAEFLAAAGKTSADIDSTISEIDDKLRE